MASAGIVAPLNKLDGGCIMARSEVQAAGDGSKERSKSAAEKLSDVSTVPLTAAVAWGMVQGPAFKQEDERRCRNLVNKELRRHRLWLELTRLHTGTVRQWRLMRTGRSRALIAEGRLQHCCMEALKIITPGGNDADV